MATVGIIVLVATVILILYLFDPTLQRMRDFNFELKARVPRSDEQMIAMEFATENVPPEVPPFVRRLFGKYTGYPAEMLRADDDFAFFLDDMDMHELITELFLELEAVFNFTVSDSEFDNTPCTVRGYSRLVANKIGPKG